MPGPNVILSRLLTVFRRQKTRLLSLLSPFPYRKYDGNNNTQYQNTTHHSQDDNLSFYPPVKPAIFCIQLCNKLVVIRAYRRACVCRMVPRPTACRGLRVHSIVGYCGVVP
jgi:hypothetical protein